MELFLSFYFTLHGKFNNKINYRLALVTAHMMWLVYKIFFSFNSCSLGFHLKSQLAFTPYLEISKNKKIEFAEFARVV